MQKDRAPQRVGWVHTQKDMRPSQPEYFPMQKGVEKFWKKVTPPTLKDRVLQVLVTPTLKDRVLQVLVTPTQKDRTPQQAGKILTQKDRAPQRVASILTQKDRAPQRVAPILTLKVAILRQGDKIPTQEVQAPLQTATKQLLEPTT